MINVIYRNVQLKIVDSDLFDLQVSDTMPISASTVYCFFNSTKFTHLSSIFITFAIPEYRCFFCRAFMYVLKIVFFRCLRYNPFINFIWYSATKCIDILNNAHILKLTIWEKKTVWLQYYFHKILTYPFFTLGTVFQLFCCNKNFLLHKLLRLTESNIS